MRHFRVDLMKIMLLTTVSHIKGEEQKNYFIAVATRLQRQIFHRNFIK